MSVTQTYTTSIYQFEAYIHPSGIPPHTMWQSATHPHTLPLRGRQGPFSYEPSQTTILHTETSLFPEARALNLRPCAMAREPVPIPIHRLPTKPRNVWLLVTVDPSHRQPYSKPLLSRSVQTASHNPLQVSNHQRPVPAEQQAGRARIHHPTLTQSGSPCVYPDDGRIGQPYSSVYTRARVTHVQASACWS